MQGADFIMCTAFVNVLHSKSTGLCASNSAQNQVVPPISMLDPALNIAR